MNLIKLTGLPHPEMNGGKSGTIYVDANRIVYLETSAAFQANNRQRQRSNEAVSCLFDEIQRVERALRETQVSAVNIENPEPAAMKNWNVVAAAARDLKDAYDLIHAVRGSLEYPPVVCTTIGLALINDNGQQLSRLHVMETTDQIAALICSPSA